MDANILDLYEQAFTALYIDHDKPTARELFFNGVYKYPEQADFFRGMLASKDTTSLLTHEQVRDLYTQRASFGLLSKAIDQSPVLPFAKYQTPWFDYIIDISTITRLHAAEAIRLSCAGKFNDADFVIISSPSVDHPLIRLAHAVLMTRASRWVDAFDIAKTLLDVELYNPITDEPEAGLRDRELYFFGRFIMGVSLAHLGHADNALQHFHACFQAQNLEVQAEAYRWAGLVSRQQSKFHEANDYFSRGLDINPTPALQASLRNPLELYPITTIDAIAARTDYYDVTTQPKVEVLREDETETMRELARQAQAMLDAQVGMEDVKHSIELLKAEMLFDKQREARGLPAPTPSRHLVLAGPPGTGKTTVARIIAKLYASFGVVATSNMVEATRSDLIGSDEGSTAAMTKAVIDSAIDGVLFIDEAYDLIQNRKGEEDHRGQEAVTILLQEMENHRDRLVVIIAGYEGPLNRFLATNPGLRSRFARWISFSSYEPDDIVAIADGIAQQYHNTLTPEAKAVLRDETSKLYITDYAGVKMIDKLANGRFARNVIEAAERHRLERLAGIDLASVDSSVLMTLSDVDMRKAVHEVIRTAE